MPCLCKIYNKRCLVQHVLPEKSTQLEHALEHTQHICPVPQARLWAEISSCCPVADCHSLAAVCDGSPSPACGAQSAKGRANCCARSWKWGLLDIIRVLLWQEHRKDTTWGWGGLAAFCRCWQAHCLLLEPASLREKWMLLWWAVQPVLGCALLMSPLVLPYLCDACMWKKPRVALFSITYPLPQIQWLQIAVFTEVPNWEAVLPHFDRFLKRQDERSNTFKRSKSQSRDLLIGKAQFSERRFKWCLNLWDTWTAATSLGAFPSPSKVLADLLPHHHVHSCALHHTAALQCPHKKQGLVLAGSCAGGTSVAGDSKDRSWALYLFYSGSLEALPHCTCVLHNPRDFHPSTHPPIHPSIQISIHPSPCPGCNSASFKCQPCCL